MLNSRDVFKPIAQTVESKLVTGAPVDFTGAFVGTQNEPLSATGAKLTQAVKIPFAPIYTTQPVEKPVASVMGGADLYSQSGITPLSKITGASGSPLVEQLNKSLAGDSPLGAILGGAMPPVPMPPLNLNMTTSSEAKTGAQTASGGFVSHGINFGTTGGNNQLLILGALALAAFFLMRKK